MTRYLEFAVASNFSFLRGASHPEELMLQAAHVGLDGLGLCDRNSLAGVVRAHLVKREQQLPLAFHPGARLVFADGTSDILAYPRDRCGWGRLCRLLTRGNLRSNAYDPIYGKRALADDQSLNYVSYYIENGNYWKIDNITAGYNLRLKNKYLKHARVYLAVANLYTITGYKGIDPEVGISGLAPGIDDKNRYPATTSFTAGASLTF